MIKSHVYISLQFALKKNCFICWPLTSLSGLLDHNDLLKISIWNEFFRSKVQRNLDMGPYRHYSHAWKLLSQISTRGGFVPRMYQGHPGSTVTYNRSSCATIKVFSRFVTGSVSTKNVEYRKLPCIRRILV